ncbi:flagellar hook-basal body complex protein FliE [Amphritea balenae]|uniref:Flagellar hook-basal body complex protein FliE n=1 Tax=Amphritea balenae TaxID=452629 RepID=A0A3P1SPZ0_9GAMM|nr:flagellar hook-basal body complex protein FliE [Amphritea balenae]RRC99238.1 flagellar hook-basal body complex protein FliE [Amphritea balenae]GGK72835.1 flagellar hook-basal body complex protein FliE [Amphritea balenae]
MVERAEINSVLQQMRDMKMQAQQGMQPELNQAQSVRPVADDKGDSFADLLKNAVDGVNNSQAEAKSLATAYEKGVQGVDLHQVMISMEKASVSFQAMTQVRNRMVSAYEDVMKMPI